MPDRDAKGRYLSGHLIAGPGRNTAYEESHNELVYRLSLLGLTEEHMAEVIGISPATFDTWKEKHPAFLGKILEGKEIADANVAHGLYRRGSGMVARERREECVKDPETGNLVPVKTVDVTREIPPDPTAAMHWLGLRRASKEFWAKKGESDPDAPGGAKSISSMTDEELEAKRQEIEERLNAAKED